MSWNTDSHGVTFKPSECKLYGPSHTWGMKLSQIGVKQFPSFVGVATFSFQLDYAIKQVSRIPDSMHFICNSKFDRKAHDLKCAVPACKVFVNSRVHQKLILVPEDTIYLGSLNMVNQHSTCNSESTIGVRSLQAYSWAMNNLWIPLIESSQEVIL